jgi:glycogen operon protein
VKNFFALLLLSAGTPMLLMGDEMRHSQRGNNNAYCQDNELAWLDWNLLRRHADVHRFVSVLNAFRQRRDVVFDGHHLSLNALLQKAQIAWHGVELDCPDWSQHSRSIAFTLRSFFGSFEFHGMLNAYWEPLTFEIPAVTEESRSVWRRCIDTALPAPDDIVPWATAPSVSRTTYTVSPRSMVLLARALPAANVPSQ